ncbi:MAG: hypothetical protein JNL83_39095, partial [Myxococcales bacterium]|nr:hypothetical protein [Myxococcales bacterium]
WWILAAIGLSACSRQTDDAPPAPGAPPATQPARTPGDAGFAVWPARLEDRTFDIAWHDMRATLTGRVPVGWISRTPGHFKVPDGDNPGIMDPSIGWTFGGVSCSGECDDGDLQTSMASAWESIDERFPRVSSGMGESDKLRLDVTVLEEGTFPDGKYKAVRVTRGAKSPGAPDYLERVEATCVRHRKGDTFYIIASTSMKLTYEKTLWPLMLEACKTPWFRS